MAVKNEIDIVINEDGSVNISVKGAKGKKCLELTKFLEEELGEIAQRDYTSEYYQEEDVEEVKRIKVGQDYYEENS